ncbi:beta strand repeat-containing protein [Mesorhizobium cantuariense]|uniref:Beta strand repeat-containing protein n=1 Tax=Mesorhizobium cantuariense TaxID=1300275 RepID=A0ABV7MR99_9HYPH
MAIDIGDDALLEATTVGSGTGNYDSFLRLQATNVEAGFNTDENGNVLDNKASFTHSLQYGDLVPITVDGVEYIEFRLDLNESNSAENGQITLTDLNIYLSGSGATLADYTAGFAGFDTVYSLDTSHLLIDANHGSGTDDYRVLIPVSSFTDAGVTADSYVTLFSGFSGSNGGFEEWRTTTTSGTGADTAAIVVEKTADPTSINEGVATRVTYTYEVMNTSPAGAADPLTLTSLVDDNATPGSPGDDINLLDGFVANSTHGTHYVSGDTDNDYLVDSDETWTFNATVNIAAHNAGSSIVNTVVVHGHDDDSLTDVTANDAATVTVTDVAPAIAIEKTADTISIDEGASGDVTYTYKVTNTSAAGALDPLTLTSLVDDNATPGSPGDDINLLDGFVKGSDYGTHYADGDTDGDYQVDSDETWTFNATVNIAAHNAGSIVNTVVVHGHDDDSLTDVTANDTATVTVTDVAPSIAIEKTADTISIDEGASGDVTYTYKVTNTSPAGALDPLTLTSLVDDNATPGSPGDDINLLDGFVKGSDYGTHYADGDTDGDYQVDSDETWTFNATVNIAAHNAGSIVNTVVVHGHDDDSLTDVTANDTATVTVNDVAPSIAIDKTVDADHDGIFHSSETVQSGAQNATYHYAITNTSAAGALDPLTLTSLIDDNGTANTGDDINLLSGFVANSSHGTHYVSGDADGDYQVDSNETWVFEATSAFNLAPNAASRTNTVEVAAHDDDSLNEVSAQDTATVSSFDGPGVRTPGFWSNLGKSFWDGVAGADKSGPNFASGELRYAVDADHNGSLDAGKLGLLIGDYNKNGLSDVGEDTFFISYADALKVINASAKDSQDTRFVIGRDAVATWLNYLAGNPIGDASDPNSPHKYLDQAIDWLQVTNGGNSSSNFEDWGGGSAVKASSASWNVGLDAESATGGSELAGNLIHQELDFYNNTGMTFEGAILHIYANDGG